MTDTAAPKAQRMPPQVPFIIGNEACERFSFYGMRNILTVFLVDYLLLTEAPDKDLRSAAAKSTFHLFVFGVYLFPLFGGWLADRVLGKYRTILSLSLVYCLGNFALAAFTTNKWGFYAGLFLIAFGSGGIKPCVSAMVGDQFDASQKHLAKTVFAAFYWSINFGSLFASLFIPKILKADWGGPVIAFGLPGVLMLVATIIFWAGRRLYVDVPPTKHSPHSFAKVLSGALRARSFDPSKVGHPEAAVSGARAVLRVLVVFLPVPFFWALFDQKASTWVLQAKAMDPKVELFGSSFTFEPSQMQFINPLLVMILIPLTNVLLYPALKKAGFEPTYLRRMTAGMFTGVASWLFAGWVQAQMDAGATMNIMWQLGPYVVLTLAEVLVSTTGLEFAYSQAPPEMKGTLMSFWSLTVAVANLGVAQLSKLVHLEKAPLFFFWAGLAFVASLAMAWIARSYVEVDYYRKATS